MPIRTFARGALALALAAVLAPAGAIDLSQAYRAALDNDSTIRAARANAAARRERLPQSRAQLLPQVAVSASRFRNILDQRAPNFLGQETENHQVYTSSNETLQVRQPIFRAALFADYKQAQAIVDDANAQLDKQEQELVVRVGGAYFEALLAEDQLQLVQAQKAAYTGQLDAARKRMAAGAGTRTDIDEAQARLDMTIAQELELKQAVDLARRQLEALVEMPLGKLATLDAAALRLARPEPDSVDPWTETAVENSPEIRSLRAQVEAARYEVQKARAGHLPTLDAVAQVSRSESDTITNINQRNNVKAIGVQLNVPLYTGGYVSSQVRQALADLERLENTLEATRRDLAVRVHREFRGVTEGVLKVQALEVAVRSAEQAVTSSRRSFEAGSRTLLDILNAQQQYATAVRDLSQARYVYLISRVRLQALAGGPRTTVLDEINAWLKP
ncbi:TolC family outer membrane protein [Ramlibacter albus]|uniref:TolC family outer membrane protein n=1 Tax=Ramlibacter albus TaxID=2079448 RepID=A0A923M916_9BURK|nr:TolC family outer membrane protein [Ramlibacter albus]MBC5764732.1 TolC family outer membrane protein [Ramlibacter albus]